MGSFRFLTKLTFWFEIGAGWERQDCYGRLAEAFAVI